MGRLAHRVGRAKVLIWGHGALLAAYATVALSWNIAVSTVLALLLLGTFYAATDGVIAALASRLVPSTVRASGIASAQTVVALSRMASSAGFGVLWFLFGPQVALILVGVALLLALPVALGAVRLLDLETRAVG
jgi:MFS family permease